MEINMLFSAQSVYDGLMELMNLKDKPFYYEDTKINEQYSYRVFCYNLPGYMEYQLPFARESRGSMFLIDHNKNEMISLIVLPMPKYFTYGEQPETQDINFNDIKKMTLKLDGSLVSSYIDFHGNLAFKTKRSPSQKSFNNIIENILYPEFKDELTHLTKTHTIDCELTSPKTRVILSYQESNLTIIKVRSKTTGEFFDIHSDEFKTQYPTLAKHTVELLDPNLLKNLNNKHRFLDLKGIEGGVIELENGLNAKIKTKYYLTQNKFANLQDFSKRDELMVQACIEETFDELRTLFFYRKRSDNYDAEGIVADMDIIEEKVKSIYNPLCYAINSFYNQNKDLILDDYISKIKEENLNEYMSLLIPMKKGVKVSLKQFFLKKYGRKIKSK